MCLFAPSVLFLSYLVASFPFVGCLDVTACMRSYLNDVGMLVSLPLSCLALHVRVSHVSLVYAL